MENTKKWLAICLIFIAFNAMGQTSQYGWDGCVKNGSVSALCFEFLEENKITPEMSLKLRADMSFTWQGTRYLPTADVIRQGPCCILAWIMEEPCPSGAGDCQVKPLPKKPSKFEYKGGIEGNIPCKTFVDTAVVEICTGDTVLFVGQKYWESGLYVHRKSVGINADSIYFLSLTVRECKKVIEENVEEEICRGDSISFQNEWFYTDTFMVRFDTTIAGIDTLIRISSFNLTIVEGEKYETHRTLGGEPIIFQEDTITTTGTHYFYFDCDTLVIEVIEPTPCNGCEEKEKRWLEQGRVGPTASVMYEPYRENVSGLNVKPAVGLGFSIKADPRDTSGFRGIIHDTTDCVVESIEASLMGGRQSGFEIIDADCEDCFNTRQFGPIWFELFTQYRFTWVNWEKLHISAGAGPSLRYNLEKANQFDLELFVSPRLSVPIHFGKKDQFTLIPGVQTDVPLLNRENQRHQFNLRFFADLN